jgi:Uma2 family endonuclease
MAAEPEARRLLTVEDLYSLPDEEIRHELQGGYLICEPLPGDRHGRIVSLTDGLLGEHVRRNRLGVVFAGDAGFILARAPDTVRGPDVAFVSRERYERMGGSMRAFPEAPDLAVEVLSPSNTRASMHAKVADYLAAGTRRVWVIDTEARTVSVYGSLLFPRVLAPTDFLEGEDVVPGFRVQVEELFELI